MLASSAKVVRTTTFTSGSSAANRRVAATPSTLGMRRSISTTVGREAVGQFDGLVAVGGQADDFEAGLGVEHGGQGLAHGPLIVGHHDPQGRRRLSLTERSTACSCGAGRRARGA